MNARDRHKVFLATASGLGKTFQMLEEGREEQSRGREVVIGYLAAQPDGLPTLSRRLVEYRSVTLEELDLPATRSLAAEMPALEACGPFIDALREDGG